VLNDGDGWRRDRIPIRNGMLGTVPDLPVVGPKGVHVYVILSSGTTVLLNLEALATVRPSQFAPPNPPHISLRLDGTSE